MRVAAAAPSVLVSVACGVADSLPWAGDGAGAGEGLRFRLSSALTGAAADAVDAANANVDAGDDAGDGACNEELEAETDVVGSAQASMERQQKTTRAHDQGRRFPAECRMTP